MERAGYGAFRFITEVAAPNAKRILIVAGKGNNAGDAFVVARYLIEAGYTPEIFLLASPAEYSEDAKKNWERVDKTAVNVTEPGTSGANPGTSGTEVIDFFDLWHGDLIIDGILGTGVKGEVAGIFAAAINCINNHKAKVLSLDIPSGLNCDTGEKCGEAVKANFTVTFAHPKLAMFLETGAEHCGRVEIIDIGISKKLSEKALEKIEGYPVVSSSSSTEIVDCFPQKKLTDHKNKFGHLLIIAGSKGMTGAAVLCAKAAGESGTGLITVAVPESLLGLVAPLLPACMTLPVPDNGTGLFISEAAQIIEEELSKFQAVAIGPGLGKNKQVQEFLASLLPEINLPMVIDADALNIISDNPELLKELSGKQEIFTPHPGEFSRLTKNKKISESTVDRIFAAHDFADSQNLTLLLKGFQTVICSPETKPCINLTGNAGMATAGSGDVLTGIIGSFLAQGLSTADAAKAGAFLHGLAGDIAAGNHGETSVNAEKIAGSISEAFLYCE